MNEGAGCGRRHGLRSQRRAILRCRRRVLCRGSDILANGPPVTERPHMGAENGGLMKKRLGPTERLYPMPCALVVGGTMDEADVLTVAWLNIVSSTPPSLAMGLRRTRRTLELIRQSGEFTVNLPSTSLVTAGRLLRARERAHARQVRRGGTHARAVRPSSPRHSSPSVHTTSSAA